MLVILILALTLTSCSIGGASTQEVNDSVLTEEPGETYPQPDLGEPAQDVGVYPPPTEVMTPTEIPAVMYPGVADGEQIYWSMATAMILNNEVAKVVQTGDRKVTITLKDGRSMVAVEPVIDEVIRVIEVCGELCAAIVVETE